jgi:hypothetical protein
MPSAISTAFSTLPASAQASAALATPETSSTRLGGWRDTDVNGRTITIDKLSTKLTQVAAYRRTICGVDSQDYLLRRINGIEEPLVARGNQAREALMSVVCEAIASLHQTDFETLVDVIFVAGGIVLPALEGRKSWSTW